MRAPRWQRKPGRRSEANRTAPSPLVVAGLTPTRLTLCLVMVGLVPANLMPPLVLGLGLAGGGFAVGVAYVSKWYPQQKQGTALGFFGMGNVGAAVTKFGAPFVMVGRVPTIHALRTVPIS